MLDIQFRNFIFLLLSIAALMTMVEGCREKTVLPNKIVYLGREYFPVAKGRYAEYKIETTAFNKLAPDTLTKQSYYQKEKTVDFEVTSLGDTIWRVEVYTKVDSLGVYSLRSQQAIKILKNKVLNVTNNLAKTVLLYPFRVGQVWNADEYNENSASGAMSKVLSVGHLMAGGMHTDAVVTVELQKDSNCLERVKSYEYYAKGTGLQLKTYFYEEYNQDPSNPCFLPPVVRTRRTENKKIIKQGVEN